MEITTTQKYLHTSPRKLKLVADMVRSLKPSVALTTLQFTNKAAAKSLIKVITSVLANAKQQNLDIEKLVFKSLEINEGPVMKRYHAQARGRVNPYKRRMSHIKIVLEESRVESLESSEKTRKQKKGGKSGGTKD